MKNKTNNQATSTLRIAVLFAVMFFSGMKMTAQVAAPVSVVAAADAPVSASVESNTNINTVSWFMGTKQTPKAGISNDGTSAKKQMINSGIAPNRLLLKTLLKKATDFQVATA